MNTIEDYILWGTNRPVTERQNPYYEVTTKVL